MYLLQRGGQIIKAGLRSYGLIKRGENGALLSSYTCSLSTECAHTILIISLVLFFTFSIRKIQGVRTRNYDLSYYKNIFSRVRSIFFFTFN